jgi:predicted Zn-dependent protease
VGLARVYVLQGKFDDARQQLQAALSLEPENPAVNGELGSLDLQGDNWADAYSHLSKAWSSDQSNLTAAIQLARTLQHLNRAADALRLLQPLAPLLNNSPAFHFELVKIYSQLGKTSNAEAERQQVAALQAESKNSLRFEDPKTYAH